MAIYAATFKRRASRRASRKASVSKKSLEVPKKSSNETTPEENLDYFDETDITSDKKATGINISHESRTFSGINSKISKFF